MGLLSRAGGKAVQKTVLEPALPEVEDFPELVVFPEVEVLPEVELLPETENLPGVDVLPGSEACEAEACLEEMGTAGIAAVTDEPEQDLVLDEMGKALREKLRRLPQKKSTPHTSLSLLKAYSAFQTGFCLSLKKGSYSVYASVGLASEKLSIPKDTIWSTENERENYFMLDTEKIHKIVNADKDLVYWVFPLNGSVSQRGSAKQSFESLDAVMILGVPSLAQATFEPRLISALLKDVADKLILPASRKTREMQTDSDMESGVYQSLEDEITMFHQAYLDFNCIVLENPAADEKIRPGEDEKSSFCKKVSDIIHKTGTVISLSSGNPLILLPIVMDRELIAHRLSKILNTRPLLSFESNNPENVLTRIDTLI